MIAATQRTAIDGALRQWHLTVRATVFQREQRTILRPHPGPHQHDRFAREMRRVSPARLHLARPCDRIPVIRMRADLAEIACALRPGGIRRQALPSSCRHAFASGPRCSARICSRRFLDLDPLCIAADEGEDGALAVAPHAADQRDIDVLGLPRLTPRAFDPEAHGILLVADVACGERRGRSMRLRQRPQFAGGGDHVGQRRPDLLPFAGLQAAIGIDPELRVGQAAAARVSAARSSRRFRERAANGCRRRRGRSRSDNGSS